MSFASSTSGDKIADGNGGGEGRDGTFEGLLGGGKEDLHEAVGLAEDFALGAVADDRHEGVETDLGGLFGHPFVAVGVLGRADGEGQAVGMGVPAGFGGIDTGKSGGVIFGVF